MKYPVQMLAFLVLLSFLLASCGRNTSVPEPEASLETQAVISTSPADGATGVSPNTPIQVAFNEPMDKASVESAFSLFSGTYDPSSNPAAWTKLLLTSMCDGTWRVRNSNAFPLSFTWDIYGKGVKGVGVAPANSDVFFYTSKGSNTVRLFVNGKQQQVKATNPNACADTPFVFSWSDDDRTVSVTPAALLAENVTYTVGVSTAATDSVGVKALTKPLTFSFSVSSDDSLTPEVQRFLDAMATLSEEDIDAIGRELLDVKLTDPSISDEALNQLAYDLTLQRTEPTEEPSGLNTQAAPGRFESFCEDVKLSPQECAMVKEQLKNRRFAFPFLMREYVQAARALSAQVYAPANYNDDNIDLRQYPFFEDAFRHTLWHIGMKFEFGEDRAFRFGRAHECNDSESPITREECMAEKFASEFTRPDKRTKLTPGTAEYEKVYDWIELNRLMDENNNDYGLEVADSCKPLPFGLKSSADCLDDRIKNGDGKNRLKVLTSRSELDPAVLDRPNIVCKDVYSNIKGFDTVCLVAWKDHPKFNSEYSILALPNGDEDDEDRLGPLEFRARLGSRWETQFGRLLYTGPTGQNYQLSIEGGEGHFKLYSSTGRVEAGVDVRIFSTVGVICSDSPATYSATFVFTSEEITWRHPMLLECTPYPTHTEGLSLVGVIPDSVPQQKYGEHLVYGVAKRVIYYTGEGCEEPKVYKPVVDVSAKYVTGDGSRFEVKGLEFQEARWTIDIDETDLVTGKVLREEAYFSGRTVELGEGTYTLTFENRSVTFSVGSWYFDCDGGFPPMQLNQ